MVLSECVWHLVDGLQEAKNHNRELQDRLAEVAGNESQPEIRTCSIDNGLLEAEKANRELQARLAELYMSRAYDDDELLEAERVNQELQAKLNELTEREDRRSSKECANSTTAAVIEVWTALATAIGVWTAVLLAACLVLRACSSPRSREE